MNWDINHVLQTNPNDLNNYCVNVASNIMSNVYSNCNSMSCLPAAELAPTVFTWIR